MKTVALVPIRLNNRRLPGKNLKPFTNGRPLCHYIFATLLEMPELAGVYAYCSDPAIVAYLPEGVTWLRRDPSMDRDTPPIIGDVARSFAELVEADQYLLTHATAPFIRASSIRRALAAVAAGDHDSAFAVVKKSTFVWYQGQPLNFGPGEIVRTQDLTPVYEETSGFYLYGRQPALRGLRVGDRPKYIEISAIEAVDIDEPVDFEIADAIFNHILKPKL